MIGPAILSSTGRMMMRGDDEKSRTAVIYYTIWPALYHRSSVIPTIFLEREIVLVCLWWGRHRSFSRMCVGWCHWLRAASPPV